VEKTGDSISPVRVARHNVRGRLNALKLCVSALEILTDRKEQLEFLTFIEQACDTTVVALDELDAVSDDAPAPQQD
jgi:hypothetical protein